MKFLIINTDYPDFLTWFYAGRQAESNDLSYQAQLQLRQASLFGVADFYADNLRKLGHEAHEIYANNPFTQLAWAREFMDNPEPVATRRQPLIHRARQIGSKSLLRYLKPIVRPLLPAVDHRPTWFYQTLAAQIKYYQPDVLLNQDLNIGSHFFEAMKPHTNLLVGQIASPLPPREKFQIYDVIISSLPNFVTYFRDQGLASDLHRLAFEPAILSHLEPDEPDIPVSFIGSLTGAHQERVQLLEHLSSELDIKIWGTAVDRLEKESPIRDRYVGSVWGTDMFQTLQRSKITINNHIGIAEKYANNMRLYEATGVGAMLLTDWKENLDDMFSPGQEVVAYHTPQECVEAVRYYLEHCDERQAIARSGQERTLSDHTYNQRMQEFVEISRRYLP